MLISFKYALNKAEMQFHYHRYRSMANNEGITALSKGAKLPKTLDLVTDVPHWTVLKYFTSFLVDVCCEPVCGDFHG